MVVPSFRRETATSQKSRFCLATPSRTEASPDPVTNSIFFLFLVTSIQLFGLIRSRLALSAKEGFDLGVPAAAAAEPDAGAGAGCLVVPAAGITAAAAPANADDDADDDDDGSVPNGSVGAVVDGNVGAVADGSVDAVANGSVDAVADGSVDAVADGNVDAVADGKVGAVADGKVGAVADGSVDAFPKSSDPMAMDGVDEIAEKEESAPVLRCFGVKGSEEPLSFRLLLFLLLL